MQICQRFILNHKKNTYYFFFLATSINFTADFYLNLDVSVIDMHVSVLTFKIFVIHVYHKLRWCTNLIIDRCKLQDWCIVSCSAQTAVLLRKFIAILLIINFCYFFVYVFVHNTNKIFLHFIFLLEPSFENIHNVRFLYKSNPFKR